jgi:molybdate transport system regulatory protein
LAIPTRDIHWYITMAWRALSTALDRRAAAVHSRVMTDLFIRVRFSRDSVLGPGKTALLEQIAETGSIRKAAAAMKMSYRRAWLLIQAMEEMFAAPVIERATGGQRGGGASLTPLGRTLVRRFRAIETRAARATAGELKALENLARPKTVRSQTRRR